MKAILKLSRPSDVFLTALTYLLGLSISSYLASPFKAAPFFLGLLEVLLVQAGTAWMSEVFRPHNEPLIVNQSPAEKEILRGRLLVVSVGTLAASGLITLILFLNQHLSLTSFLLIILSMGAVLVYALPPVRVSERGYGELVLAVQIGVISPAIGFSLQNGEIHRLLLAVTTPLAMMGLAYFLVLNFPAFSEDQKYQRGTLLRLLTWERAIPLHHSLIGFAYVMFALVPLRQFSVELVWPAFLTLPFAVFQIFQLWKISRGRPPHWSLLTSTAFAVYGLTVYLLSMSFWLR